MLINIFLISAIMETIKEFIDKKLIITTENPCVVFAGAGISFNSGVPTVEPLVKEFISKLPITPGDSEKYFSKKYPFEAFVNSIKKIVAIDELLSVFDAQDPNLNHQLIAALAKKDLLKILCTTNFDNLFEKALESKGISYKRFLPSKKYTLYKKKEKKILILKLHGSIENRNELGITIQQIARRENIIQIEKAFEDVFINHPDSTIIFMGYSFSDHFDITPLIKKYSDSIKNNILIVDHVNAENYFKLIDLDTEKNNNGFGQNKRVCKIQCNTDEFVKYLWVKCINQPIPLFDKRIAIDWKKQVSHFYATQLNNEIIRLVLSGRIMTIASYYGDAIKYYTKALENPGDDKKQFANTHSYLAQINYITSVDYDHSIELYKTSIGLRKDINDLRGISNDLAEIGVCYRMKKKNKKSLKFQQKSVRISRRIKYKEGLYTSLTSIGNIYFEMEKYKRALSYHKKAYRLANKTGDRKNEAFILINEGGACIKLKKYDKARKYLEKGYDLACQFMHYRLMATARFDLYRLLHFKKTKPELEAIYYADAKHYAELANDNFIINELKKYSSDSETTVP
jgi:tetratricopeptide (TPR) repeat protein